MTDVRSEARVTAVDPPAYMQGREHADGLLSVIAHLRPKSFITMGNCGKARILFLSD